LEANLADLPTLCDWGCKKNSQSKKECWRGYKLHRDLRRADAQDARLDAWITTGDPENPVFNDGKDAVCPKTVMPCH